MLLKDLILVRNVCQDNTAQAQHQTLQQIVLWALFPMEVKQNALHAQLDGCVQKRMATTWRNAFLGHILWLTQLSAPTALLGRPVHTQTRIMKSLVLLAPTLWDCKPNALSAHQAKNVHQRQQVQQHRAQQGFILRVEEIHAWNVPQDMPVRTSTLIT